MRPVDKGPQPLAYAPPATLPFSGPNRVLFNKLLGTHKPTMSACLNLWLRVVKAQTAKKKPKGYKNLVKAKNAIEPRVEGTYKCAGLPLTGVIGEFCSYCEVRIAGLLEVEHVLPKSQYPTFAVDWDNFLLACSACNTSKGNTPGRTTLRKWLGTAIRSETQCHGEVRNGKRFRWPDQNDDTYRLFPVELFADPTDTDTWVEVPFADAIHPTTVLVKTDVTSKTVRADIPNRGWANVKVIAKVTARQQTATLPNNQQATVTTTGTQELIDLCSLNDTGTDTGTYDRRVFHRTRVWFQALDALRRLAPLAPAQFDGVWNGVGNTAEGFGFFSVWLKVLSSASDPNGVNLAERFVADFATPDPAAPSLAFPGTDTTNLP